MNESLRDQLSNSFGRKQGRVIRLKNSYGFIRIYPPGGSRYEVFFHRSGLNGLRIRQLEVGDLVSFEIEESDRGFKAVSIELEEENHNLS